MARRPVEIESLVQCKPAPVGPCSLGRFGQLTGHRYRCHILTRHRYRYHRLLDTAPWSPIDQEALMKGATVHSIGLDIVQELGGS